MKETNKETINLSDSVKAKFNIGDKVKIKNINKETNQLDQEDYFYLKDFENKIGTICESNRNGSGIYAYRVDFSGEKFGYFYEKDFDMEEE